ncbi:MAG: substrate-binding domain-containing protein [Anaerolineae bacterium]|nr:substrate-binding domain-containing protein [Anaerolineae bacterium]
MSQKLGSPKPIVEVSRREFLKAAGLVGAGVGVAGLLGACAPAAATAAPEAAAPAAAKLKAAYIGGGMQVPWVPRGIDAAKQLAELLGVEITVLDSELSADKQIANYEDVAADTWDFVVIQSIAVNSGAEIVQKIVDKGIPVINIDGWIADPHDKVKIHTMIKSDSVAMGESLIDYLAAAMNYKGNLVHTQGLLSHSVAQERAEGIKKGLAKYPDIKVIDETPADWDTNKVQSIWEGLLSKGDKIDAAVFHNDSMADAAASVLERAGKLAEVKIGSIDGMPFATDNVINGKFFVVAMNSCCRIFADALWAGYYAVTAKETDIPKLIIEPSPLITKENAAGYAWFQKHFMW